MSDDLPILVSFLGHGHHDDAVNGFYLLAKDSLDRDRPDLVDPDRTIDPQVLFTPDTSTVSDPADPR
ncbi:hypothetical protein ACFXK0_02430 [Nocardia sp. NPDC059177]|uniref:hypothetical protein n=1 Tax=Nocardia sp. NPDC059177 TaxID=3346759 RepID=UPI0036BA0EF5